MAWGHDAFHGHLDTRGGPTWKPLSVLGTTLLAPLDRDAEPVWAALGRMGGLLALWGAYALGERLAGRFAGIAAALVMALSPWWLLNSALGNSEGWLAAAVLWAVLAHLAGRRRAALALGVAAGLLRPEVWPFLGLYGLWLWREGDRVAPALGLAAIAVGWLLPDALGTEGLFAAGSTARKTASEGSAQLADVPFLAVLWDAVDQLGVAAAPLAVAALVPWRRAEPVLRALALAGVAYVLIVAVTSQAGFAGNPRYLVPAEALFCVLAGVGAARVPRVLAIALLVALAAFSVGHIRRDLDSIAWRASSGSTSTSRSSARAARGRSSAAGTCSRATTGGRSSPRGCTPTSPTSTCRATPRACSCARPPRTAGRSSRRGSQAGLTRRRRAARLGDLDRLSAPIRLGAWPLRADIKDSILDTVGDTPLVRLSRIAAGLTPQVVAKVEYFNPGGSIKDRVAMRMVEAAEADGRLKPGGTIIEPTSGNTGTGLAIAARIKGYRVIAVMPDKMSKEKIDLLRAYGAEVVVTPTDVDPDSPQAYYRVADRLTREIPGAFQPNQYANPANPQTHYETTGPELWRQTGGAITHLVVGVGTGGTITGTGRYLKEQNPAIEVIGADPVGSIYSNEEVHPYLVEGVGEDFWPATYDPSVVDRYVTVSDKDSFLTTRRLAEDEGLLVGGSCGLAMHAALEVAAGIDDPDAMVAVILPDGGRGYLSKIFNDTWMDQYGFLERADQRGRRRAAHEDARGRDPVVRGRPDRPDGPRRDRAAAPARRLAAAGRVRRRPRGDRRLGRRARAAQARGRQPAA